MADTWFTQQEGSKTAPNTIHEKSVNRISPGPYVGIVKNVIDPLYSGVLQVYIPELGGDPTDKTSWKNMMYATPFYGRTNIQSSDSYASSPHSYGMWFVPPDIDNKVLCMFVNGDPARGYWFACIPDWPALHMLPGIAAPVNGSDVAPVVDHYDSQDNPLSLAEVRKLPKFVHEDQRAIWDRQGLTQDPDRGPGRSSAQRETPSSVFGISTPGRPIMDDDPKLYPDNLGFTSGGVSQKTPGQLSGVMGRKGGHTFVMDDGDSDGKNQMFRLRSAAGHMILMNDTKEFIYIINSRGTAWVEMDATGNINIYNESNMNIYAKEGFNLETQKGIKMHGATVDIVADNGFNIQAAEINMLASGSAKLTAKNATHIKAKSVYVTGDGCIQLKSSGHIDADSPCHTINTTGATAAQSASEANKPQNLPAHEPRNPNTASSKTASSTTNTQNNTATNPANPYGAAQNFGSGSAQQNYGGQTNNVPIVTYNNNPQGTTQGQASISGGYQSPNNSGGISWTTAGAIAGAVAGVVLSSGSSNNVSGNDDNKLSVGEAQNNPGNLPYTSSDKFAVGYSNGLAVYSKPEDGIAALAVYWDSLNTSTATRSIDIIQQFLNAKSNNDPHVIDMTRYMQNNLGIVADDYVALSDPNTRLGWVAYTIQYLQGRLIYSYNQTITGCAASLGLSVTDFLHGIQPITKPWQNSNGSNPLSGFVNPAKSNSGTSSGSSPLKTIGSALTGGLIGGLIGSIFDQPTNSGANQASVTQGSGISTKAGETAYTNYLGQVVGSGQCVDFVKAAAPDVQNTATWKPGNSVLIPNGDGTYSAGNTPPGTPIACGFDGPNGAYANVSGDSHAAVMGHYIYDTNGNCTGFTVEHQYLGQAVTTATISVNQLKKEGAQNFSEITHDGITPFKANGSVYTVTQNQIDNANGNPPTYANAADNVAASAPTNTENAYNYDNSGYRDMKAGPTTEQQYLDAAGIKSDNSAASVDTPVAATTAAITDKTTTEENYLDAAGIQPVPNTVSFAPTNEQQYLSAAGISQDTTNTRDSASSNVVNDNTPTLNNNIGVTPPDAADAPLSVNNYQTTYDIRTGDVVTVGSSNTAVIPVAQPDTPALNGVRPEISPTANNLVNTPITGDNKAPGTGGQSGGQTTPQGSSSTGAGGNGC